MAKRKYQDRDLKDIIEQINCGFNVMYQLPTGGGKSVVAGEFVHHFHEKQILVLAHRRELILQLEEKLSSDKVVPGVLIGEVQRNLESNILIGSVQTLSRDNRLQGILNKKWDIVIVDEAHHLRTPSYDKILDHLLTLNPDVRIFGLSATPYRYDKKEFTKYIHKLITSESVDSLITQGYLSKFRTFVTSIGDIDSEVEKTGEDYNATQLSQYMRKQVFLDHLVHQYTTKGESRQCLVFCVDKNHANSVEQTFIEKGITSVKQIIAETPLKEREQILNDYRNATLQVIISIGTLTEGVDLPDTGCVLVARPTESLVLFHQIGGRGMRISEKYKDLIFLDCAGVTLKHGALNSPRKWSLDPTQDPKELTKRSKPIGKRSDGTYTEDIIEIESGDLEVIEMTPEEYLSHSSNAIDEAKKINEKIESDLSKMLAEFCKAIGNLITVMQFSEENKLLVNEDKCKQLELMLPKFGDRAKIAFDIFDDGTLVPKFEYSNWYSSVKITGQDRLQMNEVIGELSTKILKQGLSGKYVELQKQMKKIEGGKVDVKAIEEQQKKFKREQFELKLQKLVALQNGEIQFEEDFNLGYQFNAVSGRCDRIVLSRDKILSTNKVDFYFKDRHQGALQAMEKPKFFEFLEDKKIKGL